VKSLQLQTLSENCGIGRRAQPAVAGLGGVAGGHYDFIVAAGVVGNGGVGVVEISGAGGGDCGPGDGNGDGIV
jgi:hypothetical protein